MGKRFKTVSHRVVGNAGHGNIELCARDEELEAFKLIAPFRSKSATEPINPAWRPPTPRVSLRADAA